MDKRNDIININRIVLWLLVILLVVVSTIYFARCYLCNNELIFTSEDSAVLLLFLTFILFMSAIMIFLVIKVYKLEKFIIRMVEGIVLTEDNLICFQRTTQNMIMDLSKKLGVNDFEKRL